MTENEWTHIIVRPNENRYNDVTDGEVRNDWHVNQSDTAGQLVQRMYITELLISSIVLKIFCIELNISWIGDILNGIEDIVDRIEYILNGTELKTSWMELKIS